MAEESSVAEIVPPKPSSPAAYSTADTLNQDDEDVVEVIDDLRMHLHVNSKGERKICMQVFMSPLEVCTLGTRIYGSHFESSTTLQKTMNSIKFILCHLLHNSKLITNHLQCGLYTVVSTTIFVTNTERT